MYALSRLSARLARRRGKIATMKLRSMLTPGAAILGTTLAIGALGGCSDDTSEPPPPPECRIEPSNVMFWSDNEYVNGQDLEGTFIKFGMELIAQPVNNLPAPTSITSVAGHIEVSTDGTPVPGRFAVESYTFTAGTDSTDGDLIVWFKGPIARPDDEFHITRATHTEITISGLWNDRTCSTRAIVDDNVPSWGW
jgi:hypothetical protein